MNDTSLYGAWINPKGELIPVSEEGHYEVAFEILESLGLLNEQRLQRLNSRYSWRHLYRIMFFLGYCRVIFKPDSPEPYTVELSHSHRKRHKSWVKTAEYVEYEPHFAKKGKLL